MNQKEWFNSSVEDLLGELDSGREGTSDKEAKKRRQKNGPNKTGWRKGQHFLPPGLDYSVLYPGKKGCQN